MTTDNIIECTINWVVYGQEYQRDLIIRDRPIIELITGLVDRLGLRSHIDGPTESVATLHSSRLSPSYPTNSTLADEGIRDGDQIWLILTPTSLPVRVHWSVNGRKGESAILLHAASTVAEHIVTLIDNLGLREYVDGPAKAVPALHATPDAATWDGTQTFLDLGLHEGTNIWLSLAPQYMPIVLHWVEDGKDIHKQRYLSISKTVGEHINDLVRLLAVESEVNGASKSIPSLHSDPKRPALPADQMLARAGIRDNSAIWFVLTPTYVTVTLHYPQGEGVGAQLLTLPRTRPIKELNKDLVRQLGMLMPANMASAVTLHPSVDGNAWSPTSTLAHHDVCDGDQIWLKIAPTVVSAAPIQRILIIAGSIVAVLVLIFFLSRAVIQARVASPSPTVMVLAPTALPTLVAPKATLIPTTISSLSIVTPTRDPEERKRLDYALGREAYNKQAWATAAATFERVVVIDPNYLEVREILAATYYNWAVNNLDGPSDADHSLEILRHTFTYSPTHQLGRFQEQLLTLYAAGRASSTQEDWQATVDMFEQLRILKPDFLDVTQRLYEAYMARGNQLEQQNDGTAARDVYQQATELPGIDTSGAQKRIAALIPTSAPTPTLPAVALIKLPDVHGADVGRARTFLQKRGFRVAVSPLPSDQVGSLCNGWVSYTSPLPGRSYRWGTTVRLFYRGFEMPNPPGCG